MIHGKEIVQRNMALLLSKLTWPVLFGNHMNVCLHCDVLSKMTGEAVVTFLWSQPDSACGADCLSEDLNTRSLNKSHCLSQWVADLFHLQNDGVPLGKLAAASCCWHVIRSQNKRSQPTGSHVELEPNLASCHLSHRK